jgi:hypothetical protein
MAHGVGMKKLLLFLSSIYELLRSSIVWFLQTFRKNWWKYAIALVLLPVSSTVVTSIFTKAYRSRDVGTDSWFDRIKGKGWDYERGAAQVGGPDRMGDNFNRVIYLSQGWSPAQSMWFYSVSQGSDLIPYDFFLALEQTDTTELFRSDDHMNSYRYLPQQKSISNPDALPVGFVKDSYKGHDYVGLTCAACHTNQINVNGTAIRIDGAPAMADMDTFLHDLALDVCLV